MAERIVLIGAGGCARDILDICNACIDAGSDYEVVGYVVDPEYGDPGEIINDRPILGDLGWFDGRQKGVSAICALGDSHLRMRLVQRAEALGIRFCNIVHPHVLLTRWVRLGEGVVISAGCVFTNQIRIGNHVHLNINCSITHDVVIEDFVTLAVGVNVSGGVRISTGCYVGTGANLVPGIQVGEWSVVGAGSTVIRDVGPNSTVVGVPGRVVKKRESGWHLLSLEQFSAKRKLS